VELLKQNPDKISWIDLSSNANAKRCGCEMKPQQNQLGCLSRNTNTEAMKLLKQNSYMIDWWNLSCNSNADAVELLKKSR
jgi:hypothetical protein